MDIAINRNGEMAVAIINGEEALIAGAVGVRPFPRTRRQTG